MEKRSTNERASNKEPQHKTSESQQPKEALLENEALYEHLADSLPEPVVILQDDRYQFINPAFTHLFGYTRQDLDRGLSFLETIQEQDKKAARQRYEDRLAGKQLPKTNTIDLIAKDGTLVPCETSATMIQYQGRPADLVIIRDITERKRAEETIRQQQEFLESTIEALTHPFYVIDANDYTIKLANTATCLDRISEGTTCYALTHKSSQPCQGAKHPCPLTEVKKTKRPLTVEHAHYDKEGNPRIVEVCAYPIFDSDGNVIQVIEYCLDITERKQAEEALRESEERLHKVVQNMPVMMDAFDSDENIVTWNRECERVTGYSAEEIIGNPKAMEMLYPDKIYREKMMKT